MERHGEARADDGKGGAVKVDNEMMTRAVLAAGWHPSMVESDQLRLALEAALNPPREPEIKVTLEMQIAGADILEENKNRFMLLVPLAAEVYRAMRKLEPMPTPCKLPFVSGVGTLHKREGDLGIAHHRRKDDPK